MVTIYHNPRCSKSRECLALLETRNIPFTTIKYLDTPLSKEEIKELLKILKIKPLELVRHKEEVWIEKYKGRKLTGTQIIAALARYPELIERPIVTNGYNGVIARPAEKIDEIFTLTKI